MITYSNIQRFDNMPFDEYLKLDGLSHSFLKRERMGVTEELTITDNITIGKLVDGIITDPGSVNMADQLYPAAKSISAEIKNSFGSVIKTFEKQVSFKADMTFRGFTMRTKGRLDFLLPKHAIIDLKVTKSKQIDTLIEFMGYNNQVWHYAKPFGIKQAYFMIHSIPLNKTFLKACDTSADINEFWAEKCINFGRIAA